MKPLLALTLALACAATPRAWAADEQTPQKPALTKEQERETFHPRATGMDPAPRLEGFARRQEMEKSSIFKGLPFRNVGPEVQGGRIVDIEGVPNKPDALLVAFASGGLWRTENRGGSWNPLFDQESALTIGDFAVADPDARILYVGTGENNSSRSSYSGTGIFKSTDAGATWTHVGLSDSHHVGRVLVDPRDANVVYVAALGHLYTENAERGVFKTTDGGKTWTRTLFVDERSGAIDLVQDPKRPDILYAATWEKARAPWNFLESGSGSGIWKSTDAGATWKKLAGGLPSGATLGRIGLAIAASAPDTVYAVIDNQALRPDGEPFDEDTPPGELTARRLRGLTREAFARLDDAVLDRFLRGNEFPTKLKAKALKRDVKAGRITLDDLINYVKDANRDLFERDIVSTEVYRSDDGGTTWRRTHDKRIEQVFYSYGYYFARITVDPTNTERIYFGGVPLLTSSDGGRTFKGLDQRGVHVDHHVLHVDPRSPNHVALGNDGGLNLSYDHGETWTKINNLPVGQFTTLALDNAEPYNIVGGLQDNGVMRGPSTYVPGKSNPDAWKPIYGGDGSAVVIDPKDANVVYAAFQFGYAARLNLKSGERKRIRPRPELTPEKKEPPLRYNWVTPFILSPHSREILYFGANRLYRSFDRGDTWTALSGDLTSNRVQGDVPFGTLTSVAESPKRFGLLYAGTDEGKVWMTPDGGVTWTDVSAGLARDRWVTRVIASEHDENTVYVSQNGYRNDDFAAYLFRSTNRGQTWESIAAGLPAEPINSVREDPKAKHLLYVATDMGVFVSLDKGATWAAMAGNLPNVPVHDLQVHPKQGDLVLATHGRSIYLTEAAPLRKLTPSVMGKTLHAFAVKSLEADPNRGYGDHPWITWPRQDVVVRIPYWSKAGGAASVRIKDEHGSVWQELSATGTPGLNVVSYDLSADPKMADAAEAAARAKTAAAEKQAEKGKARKPAAPKAPAPVTEPDAAEPEEEPTEEEDAAATSSSSGKADVDPELERILADPLRSSRPRYLKPGKYTVEIRVGGTTTTTALTLKPAKDSSDDEEEAER